MELEVFIKWVIWTILYSFIWIFIMVVFVIIVDKTTKFSIKKEIVEDENVALWVMLGCFFIAVAIIIAAAII